MKLSGLTEWYHENLMAENACVISMMCDLVEGKADVSIIEKRLTTHDRFKDRIEYFSIPGQFVPPAPLLSLLIQ